MRVNFNLKQTVNENLPTQLMMAMTIQKKRIRVYTKIRVCPCEWDKRNKCCILLSHLPLRRTRELQLMNRRIRWMEEQVHRTDYEKAVKGLHLTQDDVSGIVRASLEAQTEEMSPVAYLQLLVESYANGINHRGLKGSTGSQSTYRVALKRLENFCRERNFRLASFDDFDRLFFSEFTHYLYNYRFERGGKQMQYSAITVINTLKVIKNLLHRAYDNEMTNNVYYNKVHTHAQCSVSEKIYLKEEEIDDYTLACQMLGMSFPCSMYMPSAVEMTPEMEAQRKRLFNLLERYKNLQAEHNEFSVQIRNQYAVAKNKGISVPMLKKAVDFCIHPDKLRAYYDSNPLLESYVQVVEEMDS